MSLEPEPPDLPPAPVVSVGETVAADQAVAHAATSAGHHGPFHSHCENCGTKLEGPWCHRCGQHDFEFHRSFRHVLLEALESFLHFDGTFFRSTGQLLFRPGRLTAEFNAGRRAAQMPPFRLYVFVAFLFFLVMHYRAPHAPVAATGEAAPAAGADAANSELYREAWRQLARELKPVDWADAAKVRAVADLAQRSAARAGEELNDEDAPPSAPVPELIATAIAKEKGDVAPLAKDADAVAASRDGLHPRLRRIIERAQDPEERRVLGEKYFAALPKVMLVCLPLFALFTRLLYRRTCDMVYLKHLVLALHFHTFFYLWRLISDGLEWLAARPGWGLEVVVSLVAGLWLCVYPFLMFRRLFANSWPKTIVKTVLLTLAYGAVLSGAMVGTVALLLLF